MVSGPAHRKTSPTPGGGPRPQTRLGTRHSSTVIDRHPWAGDRPRMAVALDTLAYARRLREAGLSSELAEGHAEALAAAMTDTLATKQDLSELGVRMDARMDTGFLAAKRDVQEIDIRMQAGFASAKESMREMELRIDARFGEQSARLRGELADLERRMTIRLGTVTVAAVSIVSAIVKLL